jgi:hypothetical protein
MEGKDRASACLLVISQDDTVRKNIRQFGTITRDLRQILSWLTSEDVQRLRRSYRGLIETRMQHLGCGKNIRVAVGLCAPVKQGTWPDN